MDLENWLKQIAPADPGKLETSRAHWNQLAKPLGSLGALETAITKIAALNEKESISLEQRVLVVFCADNGVTAQGVSQSDASVTAAVATALGAGVSTVNYMARTANCRVVPVDVGVLNFPGAEGVINCRVRNGTQDITRAPAMTREECVQAITIGASVAAETEADILLLGEMGIANTTTSAAVACVLLEEPVEKLAGRGAGLSDEAFARKRACISAAIARHQPDKQDPVDVLQKVGGLDLAAMCGFCLGAAAKKKPVILDGLIADVAALCAVRICPSVCDALIAGHVSAEPAAALILKELGLQGLVSAGMRLGEGTGAVAALPLLDQALAVYHSGHTFGHLGIEAYQPQ